MVSVSAPLSEAEARLLTAVGETAARAAVCLNKVDLLSPEELTESLEFVAVQIEALTGAIRMPVFPVSAWKAARGDDGGLGALRRFLSDVIVHEREEVVGARARKVADGLVSLADAAIRLERAASSRPGEEARAARAAFAGAQAALATDAGEAMTLLLAACRRTETDVIEPRAQELRDSLPPALLAGSDDEWDPALDRAAPRGPGRSRLSSPPPWPIPSPATPTGFRSGLNVWSRGRERLSGSTCRHHPMSARI